MSKASNLTDFLTDVAQAIRNKKGTTAKINPQNFSSEIASIETSKPPKLQNKSVMPGQSDETVLPDSGYDGLSSVLVYGDSNLVSSNIKTGVTLFGVTGTYGGGGTTIVVSSPFNDIY